MADGPGDPGVHNAEGETNNVINENPNVLVESFDTVVNFFAENGWFIVLGIVFLIILWSNVEKKINEWMEKAKEAREKKDLEPDIIAKRAAAMELSRQRMQEKASAILSKEAERRRELEEQKRVEKLEDYDAIRAGKSLESTQKKLQRRDGPSNSSAVLKHRPTARPLRDDYNPMTGSSSSRYRPPARRTGGG